MTNDYANNTALKYVAQLHHYASVLPAAVTATVPKLEATQLPAETSAHPAAAAIF